MILGGEPTIHLPVALEICRRAATDDAAGVEKPMPHATAQARALLDGMFDVWLADYKFGNDHCAKRLASVPRYQEVVRENLVWANRHSELIVRHLLIRATSIVAGNPLPAGSGRNLPTVKVSLRSGFSGLRGSPRIIRIIPPFFADGVAVRVGPSPAVMACVLSNETQD